LHAKNPPPHPLGTAPPKKSGKRGALPLWENYPRTVCDEWALHMRHVRHVRKKPVWYLAHL